MNSIDMIVQKIGEDFKDNIGPSSRNYTQVNLGQVAKELGLRKEKKLLRDVEAIVPLRRHMDGMKVRIDGRTFRDYREFENGVVLPGDIARDAIMLSEPYEAQDSMIYNS
jgi:hypothetical protein